MTSGVFEKIRFEKIELAIWPDEDLIKAYNELRQRSVMSPRLEPLNEEENARKIVYIVGMQSLVNELERRENKKKTWSVASQVLSTALSVAVSLI